VEEDIERTEEEWNDKEQLMMIGKPRKN